MSNATKLKHLLDELDALDAACRIAENEYFESGFAADAEDAFNEACKAENAAFERAAIAVVEFTGGFTLGAARTMLLLKRDALRDIVSVL